MSAFISATLENSGWFRFMSLAVCIGIAFVGWRKKSTLRYPLPPSPPGWPILGQIFYLNMPDPWKVYHKWCTDIGSSIIHLNMAGTVMIVLNSYDDCQQLLEKRSALYSGRSPMHMVNDLMGWDFDFAWMDYGNVWRNRRRIMADSFNSVAVKSFRPTFVQYARDFLPQLLHTTHPMPELRHLAGRTIMSIGYGLQVQSRDDPYIQAAERGNAPLFDAAIPGKFLVDYMPILKHVPEWVPGASFKRKARVWKGYTLTMLEMPFNAFLKAMESGEAMQSFCYSAFQRASGNPIYTTENIRAVAGTLYQTGSDTTMSLLGFCIMSLLDRLDVVKKIQEEIDAVTENTRLPEYSDEMPWVTATLREAMRYWSLVPLAVTHVATEDDIYKGYAIPKGTTIIPNSWAILHNEEVFPEPFKFKPERFLSGPNLEEKLAHYSAAWGYGRRVCPGQFMAFDMAWITLAHIFAIYDISKVKDASGTVIEPPHEPSSTALLLMPQDYQCRFTPRSREAEELLAAISEPS